MNRPGFGFRITGACFVIGGLLLFVLGGLEAAHQLEILGYRDARAPGTVAALDPSGKFVVSFPAANGDEVEFEHNKLLRVVSYLPPYRAGETVEVRYRADNYSDAGIADGREWFGIAVFALLGLLVIVWGWLIGRLGAWGALAGLAGWIVVAAVSDTATAAVFRLFGY